MVSCPSGVTYCPQLLKSYFLQGNVYTAKKFLTFRVVMKLPTVPVAPNSNNPGIHGSVPIQGMSKHSKKSNRMGAGKVIGIIVGCGLILALIGFAVRHFMQSGMNPARNGRQEPYSRLVSGGWAQLPDD